ncbi:MAG TPA: L-seryl-tRNA(Sec) selenium transferase, partial [Candidatus Acidoferrum sp.]|nr:L-seryl-tRNA(Sec) selenium transferase [Candidatus Acidoferrum sp.]
MGKVMRPDASTLLRQIPGVDEFLALPRIQGLLAANPRWVVLEAVRQVLADRRQRVLRGGIAPETAEALLATGSLVEAVADTTAQKAGASFVPVINATGVVLHTNLGRAPLASAALEAIRNTATGYANLEFDLATGTRGSRQVHVEGLLCALTGAQAALVVNNNAAAVLLAINTCANDKEIVVSRGQLVEIGDSFRIPDVMVRAGGRLREVGTTNRTHLRDYEEAIGPETVLILRVHRSNFQILGFTADVELPELVALARRHNLLVMDDLGSGAVLDLSLVGLRREPLAA